MNHLRPIAGESATHGTAVLVAPIRWSAEHAMRSRRVATRAIAQRARVVTGIQRGTYNTSVGDYCPLMDNVNQWNTDNPDNDIATGGDALPDDILDPAAPLTTSATTG